VARHPLLNTLESLQTLEGLPAVLAYLAAQGQALAMAAR
jgi:hypothetical protein